MINYKRKEGYYSHTHRHTHTSVDIYNDTVVVFAFEFNFNCCVADACAMRIMETLKITYRQYVLIAWYDILNLITNSMLLPAPHSTLSLFFPNKFIGWSRNEMVFHIDGRKYWKISTQLRKCLNNLMSS
jgi:hypothetical protein